MLVKCSVDSFNLENISHSVTLVPRMKYSLELLNDVIDTLDSRRNDLKNTNSNLDLDFDDTDQSQVSALKLEYLVVFSVDVLLHVKKSLEKISNVASIPKVLPSAIPIFRTVSANLFDVLPECSGKLSELSVHLGSIVLDSAALTTARFDFSCSNTESSVILNEVKLMANSKLNKQYPNLDFFKSCNT